MTADEFRALALALPETEEDQHMGHPDFRVRKKIFATLASDDTWGMVKLTPAQQKSFRFADPKAFEPIAGAWGKRGYTKVILADADELTVRQALAAAWRNTAPKKLAERFTDE
ncbi:MAG TPA: MmcQ/YjbR family DNA-binding protein [Pirellulaceae bacterium]|nr:MmcQ/YjbR family DNA-binding protein [Pirellulaceae bacterium]